MVYATREEVDELSEHVVQWLRDRRKPEEEREPNTPLVYVTYRAMPQTPRQHVVLNNGDPAAVTVLTVLAPG